MGRYQDGEYQDGSNDTFSLFFKFLHSKRSDEQSEVTTPTVGKIFASYSSDERLIFRVYKQLS